MSQTIEYIANNIIDADREKSRKFVQETFSFKEIYLFVEDRFRAIKQDFGILNVKDDRDCIECHEKIARFFIISLNDCLEFKEFFGGTSLFKILIDQLTQTLTSLREFYEVVETKVNCFHSPYRDEMYAFSILLSIGKTFDLVSILNKIPSDIRNSQKIKFSISVLKAYSGKDYLKFFKLFEEANYLQACAMSLFFNEFREIALNSLKEEKDFQGAGIKLSNNKLIQLLKFEHEFELESFLNWMGLCKDGTNQNYILKDSNEEEEYQLERFKNSRFIDKKRKGSSRKEIILNSDRESENNVSEIIKKNKEELLKTIVKLKKKDQLIIKEVDEQIKPKIEDKPIKSQVKPEATEVLNLSKKDLKELEVNKAKSKLAVVFDYLHKEIVFHKIHKLANKLVGLHFQKILLKIKKYRIFSSFVHTIKSEINEKKLKKETAEVKILSKAQLNVNTKVKYTHFDSKVLLSLLNWKLRDAKFDLALNVTFLVELTFMRQITSLFDRIFPDKLKWTDVTSIDGSKKFFFGFDVHIYENKMNFSKIKNTICWLCDLSLPKHYENLLEEISTVNEKNLFVVSLFDEVSQELVVHNGNRIKSLLPFSSVFAIPNLEKFSLPFHKSVINMQNITLFQIFDTFRPIQLERLEFVKLSQVIGQLVKISDKYKKAAEPKVIVNNRLWQKLLFDVLS